MIWRSFFSKVLVVVLMVAVLAPSLPLPTTPRVEAAAGTVNVNSITDPGWVAFAGYITGVKGTELSIAQILNAIAWRIAKAALKSVTRSIVEWINGGFEGSPAFTQNLQRDMRRWADEEVQSMATRLINSVEINSPYLNQIVRGAVTGYLIYSSREGIARRLSYTLNQYVRDVAAWENGDFSQGGWDAWMATVRFCGNDRYCARFATEEEIIDRIDGVLRTRLEELGWGRGFLSWRGECLDGAGSETASLSDASKCSKYDIQTPGSYLVDLAPEPIRQHLNTLNAADSINEIVDALLTQLVTQVLGATGLAGVSRPSSGGGRSLLDLATNNAADNSNLTIGFDNTVQREVRPQVEKFKANWTKILRAASEAHQVCSARSSRTTETARAAEVRAEATTNVTRADRALDALDEITERIAAIRANTTQDQTREIELLSQDYQCLLQGGTPAPTTAGTSCLPADPEDGPILPGSSEMTAAGTKAADTGDDSLYLEMTELKQECGRPI